MTQADRAARTRDALLESAAHGLARYGYGNLVLEHVARDAGYSRGALYHLFADKQDLALAVVAWVTETWTDEVGQLIDSERDPLDKLLALARGHALYCRRDGARLRMTLRSEFAGQEHPVGDAVQAGGRRDHRPLCRADHRRAQGGLDPLRAARRSRWRGHSSARSKAP